MVALYFLLIYLLALLLQTVVFPYLLPAWLAAAFDFPLQVVVHAAMTRGKKAGMLGGLLAGFAQDALAGGVVGINGISKITAGYVGGLLREKFFVSGLTHRAGAILSAVALAVLAKVVVLRLFGLPSPGLLSLDVLLTLLVNGALALALGAFLHRLEARFGLRPGEIRVEG